MKPLHAAVLSWALVASAAAAEAPAVPGVEAAEPRAFGHQVGDLVQRRVTLWLPDGWRLDETSLPRPGGRGRAVELRRVELHEAAERGGRRLQFDLEYQVFLAPAALRLVEIAPWTLRVTSEARRDELRVDGAALMVAPLVTAEAPTRRGFGDLRPDREPPLVDTAGWQRRLLLWGLLALGPLAVLFAVHVGVPWQAARRRPFGAAWRELRRLPAQPSGAEWRAALKRLHAALDHAAGEAVFEHRLAAFVGAVPRYRALTPELAQFLALSRREFFAAGPPEAPRAVWLVDLARRLRDAERGGP